MRNAHIGSTPAARRAGMNAATSVARTSSSAARTSSAGSHGRTSNNRLAINAPETIARGNAERQSNADLHERPAQHHPDDRRAVRAERHAHASST